MSNKIECDVCSRRCKLENGQVGFCQARANRNGYMENVNYGFISSMALDPIEKKPLAHFYPGSNIFSIGNFGCNLNCPFCQNHEISMVKREQLNSRIRSVLPKHIVDQALDLKVYNNIGIAFTYNEPLINYEFVIETEQLAHQYNLKTVVVTNGNINPRIFRKVAKNTDAFNIDLKGIDIYGMTGGDLDTIKENIKIAYEEGCHIEITTLIIPEVNDSIEEIREIAQFIASIDPKIPLHITRFFPQYKMKNSYPTPISKLYQLEEEASKYLKHVHLGNI